MIRWLIVIFLALVIFSGLRPWLEKLGLGKLPGDFRFRFAGREWFIPLTSSVLLSLLALLVARFAAERSRGLLARACVSGVRPDAERPSGRRRAQALARASRYPLRGLPVVRARIASPMAGPPTPRSSAAAAIAAASTAATTPSARSRRWRCG